MEDKRPKLVNRPAFRVGVVLAVILVAFALAQQTFVPKSFGEYGYYRGDSVNEWAELPVTYSAGSNTCKACHQDQGAILTQGEHGKINCESCHGPAGKHAENPNKENRPVIEVTREYCGACHNQVVGRSEQNIRQVNLEEHNAGLVCSLCHMPHNPKL
ncbi:MAG: hypothetical protein ACYC2T_04295 [Bacillota bacterium]